MLLSPIHLAHHRSTVELLSPRYRYAITLLLLRCHKAIAPLLFRCRYADVAPLLRCCRTAIAPVLLHCCSAAVAPALATLSHRYRSTVALILSLLLLILSRTAIALLSRRCRTAVARAQRGYKKFNIELMLIYCHSTVASSVNRKVHMVVASRGIIRVTVTIGDCQVHVSSSSEGCLTSQKTVKLESY